MTRATLAAIVALILVAGTLLWLWRPAPTPPAGLPAVAGRSPARVGTTAAPPPTPPPFRLAGVAVGAQNAYAVIEDPNGASGLYRVGEVVSGLGRIAGIEAQEVLVETESGPIALRIQAAPSPSPGATATRTAVSSSPAPPAESPPAPSPDGTEPESPP